MSYLTGPTLLFSGRFQADVPTENNDATFVGTPPGSVPQPGGLNWNPMGGGAFRLLDVSTGPFPGDPAPVASDAIVGAVVRGAHDRVSAKLVDLDPQWQIASELYGLRIEITAADGTTLVAGEFDPAAFRDMFRPSSAVRNAQARFQSVLQDITWAPVGTSPTIDRLRAATSAGRLSIRITTHSFMPDHTGGLAGAIGPYLLGEPTRFVSGRRFPRTLQAVGVFDAELAPDGSRLTADLATAASWSIPPSSPLGPLRFGVLTNSDPGIGDTVTDGTEVRLFGDPIPSVDPDWLAATGGIVTADVPTELRDTVSDNPLALVLTEPAPRLLMRETPDGWLVRPDRETHRLNGTPAGGLPAGVTPDDGETWIRVTRYGVPQGGRTPVVTVDPPGSGAPPGADPAIRIGVPEGALVAAEVAPTRDDGWTVARFTCGDPGSPRRPIDGQVYSVTIGIPEPAPQERIGLLVFEAVPVPDHPTWERDVLPILRPYAELYPVMTERLLDMRKYDEVSDRRQILQLALSRPITDPNSMPVTRDLSGPKRATLLKWLALPDLPRESDGPGAAAESPTPVETADRAGKLPEVDPRDAPFLGKQAAFDDVTAHAQEGQP